MYSVNKKNALIFVGGIVFSAVAARFCKSKCAKKLAVNSLAAGMKMKDDFEHCVAKIKEEAEDAYNEAKLQHESGCASGDKCCD